ncbi:MAG: Fic family protein [Mediterranea sp.]|nr:Fic family protein [Mediterranea sp.]
MKYIHEIENWTDFRWDAVQLSDPIARTNRAIGYLQGRLSAIGFDDQMLATVESVTNNIVASSEIEGINLNTAEVRSSVARKLGTVVPNMREATHYIDGVVEMMLDAVMNYTQALTHERLFGWHASLFPNGKSGNYDLLVGAYRKEGMQVVSGAFGRERVHYRAPDAELVQAEMDKFLAWFNDRDVSPSLIKSGIAHFWFVCVHPFDDGNGRIGRAIADMVLSQTDASKQRFYSMSLQISKEKKEYYRMLERAQRGDGDLTEWLGWYLRCVERAVEESNVMLSGVLNKAIFWRTHSGVVVTERERAVLNQYLGGYEAKVSAKNWSKIANVSLDTASRDLKDLMDKGMVTPVQGRVRDVSYVLNYTKKDMRMSAFSNSGLFQRDGKDYLSTVYKGGQKLEERITATDKSRLEQSEISIDDLVYKYFAYLIGGE